MSPALDPNTRTLQARIVVDNPGEKLKRDMYCTVTVSYTHLDVYKRQMHEEHKFSDLFLKFLLERSMRIQADLVDQLFNSSEKRLARILLLMAEFGKPGEPEQYIPKISQETLAEMICLLYTSRCV